METYQTTSAVLFLIFNRPDTTSLVFQEIRLAKPSKLYIAADGPRVNNESDQRLCLQSLEIVSHIDWPCEVRTLYREDNLGCKNAISSAIDWFFEQEEEGIILEDDCLPAPDFFRFCDEMLVRYRLDTRIRHITGCNLQLGKKWGNASYYFANQTHVWGWASWRRVWKDYDKTLSAYNNAEAAVQLEKLFDDAFLAAEWKRIFIELKQGKIDTWDYQLALINYFNNNLSVNPNVNLIKNIGFRADGTHTTSTDSAYANIPLETLGSITHPQYILPEKGADYAVFNRDFNLDYRWKRHNLLRRRFKRWLKGV
jgi:hypothetical protein